MTNKYVGIGDTVNGYKRIGYTICNVIVIEFNIK